MTVMIKKKYLEEFRKSAKEKREVFQKLVKEIDDKGDSATPFQKSYRKTVVKALQLES